MNYQVTLSNYKEDKYYPKVVQAVGALLEESQVVRTLDVFKQLMLLSEDNQRKWESGQVNYLEAVVECNLSKSDRVLRILRFHAHDLNLAESSSFVKRKGRFLRFSKSGSKKMEEAYARQYSVVGKR